MKNPAGNAIPFSSKRRQLDVGGFSDEAEVSFTLSSTWYYDPDVYAREHETSFPLETALASMHVIDALFRSERSGGWEPVRP